MAVIVTEGSTFEPHEEGQFRGVCVDVVESHGVQTAFGLKNKIRLVWQTESTRDDGRPNIVSASFNASLNEKSRLRPFLEAWRGKKFTAQELKGFDLEKLLGVNAVLQIQHTNKDGKTYDNVTAIMRPMKGMEEMVSRDYIRKQDREPAGAANGHTGNHAPSHDFSDFPEALEDDSDDLPF